MQRLKLVGMMLGMVCCLGSAAQAAEQGTRPSSSPAKPSSTAPPHSTQTAKVVSPTVEGTLSMLDLHAAAPTLQVKTAKGTLLQIGVDPRTTTVWQGGRAVTLSQLATGQSVKVRYTEKNGKPMARSIVVQAPASSGSSAPSTPSAH